MKIFPDSTLEGGLAHRLRLARESAGLSTRSVAKALVEHGEHVSHTTVANYEKNEGRPPLTYVAVLASILGRDINWFLQRGSVWTGVNYRKHKSKVKASDEAAFEESSRVWVEAYFRIEELAGDVLLPKYKADSSWSRKRPAAAANALRALIKLGDDAPIPSVPRLLESFGVRVLEVDPPIGVDGMAGKLNGHPIVLLKRASAADRFRLSGMHELWHHILGHCENAANYGDKESDAYTIGSYSLLPEHILQEAFTGRSMVKLLSYKEAYGISMSAMVYRAEKQGIITPSEARFLWVEFAKRGWREVEPGTVRPDRALRFEELVDQVRIAQGSEDYRAIASILGVDARSLELRMAAAIGGHVTPILDGGATGRVRPGQLRLT